MWEWAGNLSATAVKALEKKRAELAFIAAGGTVVAETTKTPLTPAIANWLEIAQEKLGSSSVAVKTLVMEEFLESYGNKPKPCFVEDISRVDCLKYLNSWLGAVGNIDRTKFNKFLHLRQFCVDHGHHIFKPGDAPKFGRRDPVIYEDDEIERFFAACNPEQKTMFLIYFSCGLRLQEVETLRWCDIDLVHRVFQIDERPDFGFKPKKWHIRDIPIIQELADRLTSRRVTAKGPLVFHTMHGKPVYHMLDANPLA